MDNYFNTFRLEYLQQKNMIQKIKWVLNTYWLEFLGIILTCLALGLSFIFIISLFVFIGDF